MNPLELDIETLIQPINDEAPTGEDLRLNISPNCSYQILRNERATARNNERQAQALGEQQYFAQSDWNEILNKTPQLLQKESKDLEVVAWYIEALTRFYGFKGFTLGFSVARQLIEKYKENLHPRPDEDGISTQISPLSGLNGLESDGALIPAIKSIAMTENMGEGALSCWQCEQVFEVERISDTQKREARIRQGARTRKQLDQVMAETSTEFLHTLQEDIDNAIKEFELYQAVIDEYTIEDPQPTGKIRKSLDNCREVLTYIAGDRLKKPEIETTENEEQPLEEQTIKPQAVTQNTLSTQLENREQALETLRNVADFFRRTEPHSPISYTIEQAVRWSRMPLTELIAELIPDPESRKKYQHLSGIPIEKAEND